MSRRCFLALVATFAFWACSESSTSVTTDQDPRIAAALQTAYGPCVPDFILTDGLGGLNPLAADGRFTTLDECDPPPAEDPFPDSAGIWIYGLDPSTCFNISWDIDNDGVHNACENALAQTFAPLLIMAHDCNWDHSPGFNRMGGEYYFAVQRASPYSDTLRIAYLPAYYWDCGTPHDFGSICLVTYGLGLPYCEGHTGDSEFILVDLWYNFNTSHWVTKRVFLSAHCGSSAGQYCSWWAASHFQWRDDRARGAPEVWVAYGKHANYYSEDLCNSAGFAMDDCSSNTAEHVFPIVYGQQNIGSRTTPLRDCATAFWGSPLTSGSAECMWKARRFNGWQSTMLNNGSAPYSDHLSGFAGF